MLKFLRSLFSSTTRVPGTAQAPIADPAPELIEIEGGVPFSLVDHLQVQNGLPVPDWEVVSKWIHGLHGPSQATAWAQTELGWLAHLRVALGPQYQLRRDGDAVLLSSLEPSVAQAALEFIAKTTTRIGKVLEGVAQVPAWGYDILVVFDDEKNYYRYISRYYPESGEFATSSGMHINFGCSHFVTMKADLLAVEPVIVHEMTHACLSHLPLPAWLNEGLAVNTESRLSPTPKSLFTPQEMHAKHMQFWGVHEIQEFWCGKSFLRADDGNMLSYDLARILVAQFADDWQSFKRFVLLAQASDGGQAAALEILHLDLGAAVCALLGQSPSADWAPEPNIWPDPPERGAFRRPS